MSIGLQIAYVIVSVLIIILVLAQKAKDSGFSTMSGGGASNDGREVGKTFEKKLQAWTSWLVVLYILISIGFTFYQVKIQKQEEEKFVADDIYNQEAVVDESDNNVNVENTDATENAENQTISE